MSTVTAYIALATLALRPAGAKRIDMASQLQRDFGADNDSLVFYALGDYGVTSCQRAFNSGLLDIASIPAGSPPYDGVNSIGYFECEEAAQRRVAQAMIALKAADKPDFVVTLGDNFYTSGLWAEYGIRKQFQQDFIEPYADMNIPFYITLGDHDHRGNVTAFLELGNRSHMWISGQNYYSKFINKFGKRVHMMVIDSVLLEKESNLPQRFGNDFHYIDAEESVKHWLWLSQALDEPADMNIVIGHKPIYSSAAGKIEVYRERLEADLWVIERLNALLHKVGKDTPTIYMNGHDHVMQHHTQPPINYFGAGNGGFHHHNLAEVLRPNCEFASQVHGFLRLTLRPSGLTADFMGVESTDGVRLRDFQGEAAANKVWSATAHHTVTVPFKSWAK